ncbi:MAG TPA: TonB-dependent receptor [Candidatus Acidoferrum sp.]|nr:TonB-dependent receptor [Candidatus Acidoferrum sp.]
MPFGKFVFRIAFLLACLTVIVTGAHAQYRAGIQGTVLDSQGNTIEGATVTLTNQETSKESQITTNSAGVYNFLGLPPGRYRLDVELTGFKKKTLENVTLEGEQTQSMNISLELGDVSQTVTVSGDSAPAIDTETGNISGTLNSNEIQNLPSLGRDPFQLLRLAPGVFGDAEHNAGGDSQNTPGSQGPGGPTGTAGIFQTENQVQVNANGQRNTANSFQVDGVSVNSLDWGGAAVITPNEESIKEVRITANSYDAQFGRTSGAQVEVVSQNGTDQYHGSLFLKIDRPGLNAYQRNFGLGPKADQRVPLRFNQYGGSVGGPIIKHHLFAFFSYETLRNNSVNTANTWAETAQYLKQAPAGSIANKLLTFAGEGTVFSSIISRTCEQAGFRTGVDCNPVGANGSQGLDIGSPITTGLGTHDPTFGQAGTPFGVGGGLDGVPDIAFVQTTNPTQITATQYNGRVDFQATHSDLITFSMYYVPNNKTFYNGNVRAANLWHSDRTNESGALLWQHTFAPTLINEARFNVSRWYFNELQSNPQEPFGLPQDVLNNPLGNINGFTFSFGANGPGVLYKTDYNIRDTATKVLGNQTLKFGFDIYRDQNTQVNAGGALPQYFFKNFWDLANDAPIQENANFDPLTGALTQTRHYYRANSYAVFFQDDWKVKPNFTVNLGLRWEYFGPLHEKHNNIDVAVPGSGTNTLTSAAVRIGGDLYNASYHNVGPQIGFAWSPRSLPLLPQDFNNHLVIRGGFGIGYSREEQAILVNVGTNPPQVAGDNLFGSNIIYAPSSDPHNFNGFPNNPNTIVAINPATNLPASGAPVSLVGFDTNVPTPVTYRYSLGTQYDMGHDWVVSVGYQGSLSRHYTRNQNLNLLYFANLNPQIQNFQRFTNDANGSYNALLTEVQHKFSHTFQIDAQYVFAKAQDNYSGDFHGDFDPGADPFDRQADFAPADYDVRHNFKLYGIWTPRIFKGDNTWLEKVFGGWMITGIINAHTGFPWTPYYGVQVQGAPNACSLVYANSNFCTVRPGAYLGGAGKDFSNSGFEPTTTNFPNRSLSYFAPPTFVTVDGPPPTPGVARNSFRGPRYSSIDATFGKAFGFPHLPVLGENAKLDLRVNFYNLFNQLNFIPLGPQNIGTIQLTPGPGGTVTKETVTGANGSFASGTNNGALGGRVIEAQVRFSF